MKVECLDYLEHQVFILESDDYIEYEDIRENIDFIKNFDKKEIIILKEKDKLYSEYINVEGEEEDVILSSSKNISLAKITSKYKLVNVHLMNVIH